jgi:hypothetical protein
MIMKTFLRTFQIYTLCLYTSLSLSFITNSMGLLLLCFFVRCFSQFFPSTWGYKCGKHPIKASIRKTQTTGKKKKKKTQPPKPIAHKQQPLNPEIHPKHSALENVGIAFPTPRGRACRIIIYRAFKVHKLPSPSRLRASSLIWDGIIDKIERHLAGWKRYLSKGGRVTLIKCTYLICLLTSCLPPPAWCCQSHREVVARLFVGWHW